MLSEIICSPPHEIRRNAECLLEQIEEVQGYLRWKGFSGHAIDQAVTVVYRAAMPYITGTRICRISDQRAWIFRVAIRAAIRAASREVRCIAVEPGKLAAIAIVKAPADGGDLFDLREALMQLTKQQSEAVELCFLRGMSQRDAARSMGISVGTLGGHLVAAKERLREILAPNLLRAGMSGVVAPGARAS
jgi:DNA-directed RNA polymerase specialized sigma24 family protein